MESQLFRYKLLLVQNPKDTIGFSRMEFQLFRYHAKPQNGVDMIHGSG